MALSLWALFAVTNHLSRPNYVLLSAPLRWKGLSMQYLESASGSIVKHRIQGFVHSEYFREILPGEFASSQDLSKESAPDRIAAVYRDDCAPAIGMAPAAASNPKALPRRAGWREPYRRD
jgi:hypothetical protein